MTQFIQRLPQMLSELLAVWIKAFGLVELTESFIHTGIP
jgi:hypothetical protein